MSRKVYIDATVEVPVTVTVKVSLLVRADDHASVDKAVAQWAKGKRYRWADVDRDTSEIVAVDGIDHSDDYTTAADWLAEAVEKRLDGKVKLLDATVIDSK